MGKTLLNKINQPRAGKNINCICKQMIFFEFSSEKLHKSVQLLFFFNMELLKLQKYWITHYSLLYRKG